MSPTPMFLIIAALANSAHCDLMLRHRSLGALPGCTVTKQLNLSAPIDADIPLYPFLRQQTLKITAVPNVPIQSRFEGQCSFYVVNVAAPLSDGGFYFNHTIDLSAYPQCQTVFIAPFGRLDQGANIDNIEISGELSVINAD